MSCAEEPRVGRCTFTSQDSICAKGEYSGGPPRGTLVSLLLQRTWSSSASSGRDPREKARREAPRSGVPGAAGTTGAETGRSGAPLDSLDSGDGALAWRDTGEGVPGDTGKALGGCMVGVAGVKGDMRPRARAGAGSTGFLRGRGGLTGRGGRLGVSGCRRAVRGGLGRGQGAGSVGLPTGDRSQEGASDMGVRGRSAGAGAAGCGSGSRRRDGGLVRLRGASHTGQASEEDNRGPARGYIRREGAAGVDRRAVGGDGKSGWGRLLSVANAIEAGACR